MTSKSKTLAGLGMRTLDEYVDSLPAHNGKTINSALEARKVETGSKWTLLNEFHTAISNNILAAGEVEVYKLKRDDCGEVTVTVIFGEGETDEFELYLFVNLFKHKPVVDDTFNDDTPAQTFGDVAWDEGTNEKSESVVVVPCPSCGRAVPYDRHGALFLVGKMAVCSDCYAKNSREGGLAGKKYITRVPNLWRRDEKKVKSTSKMRLIGIAGPARAGKDTLASYLLDNLSDDWSRSSFADPIKKMLEVLGVDCSDDAKAVIDDSYGATPRHMMQTLGTEWGRHMIDGDMWVKAFARLNAGKCVIVPDVRFENEAELVREHGVLIHLVGRGGIEGNHVSENAIEFKPGDIVIDNSRDMAWLMSQVDGNAVLADFVNDTQGEIK